MTIMIPAWVDGTLVPVEKLEAHERGLKHKAVSVFVLRGREVLMQQRAMSKYHTPGLWTNTCCTHPLWNETASACAARRLNEELGITGLLTEHRHQLEYRADVGNGMVEHELVDVFLAEARPGMKITPNADEVLDVRWIDYHDLLAEVQRHPQRFTPWLRIYLTEHANVIFGPHLTYSTQQS
ncbi:isopentenyl-diphosphate Delta-isomerase [Aliishimia ponticola]|uniref:Isopentenyl-diphosphate Delta-isomerase n=1 Tax=Aliishimia ponticola TaxID=2499833 RepID=A0A4S4NBM7_9RHOB|nr:isopentenyl-diphosphate Delta-isomerase [Aliishimia ponticola]THH35428.1 isopentenyl-diphosphate Delta-isomerase [Aliishimia ponticola]